MPLHNLRAGFVGKKDLLVRASTAQHVIVQCDSTYCCFLLQAGERRIDFDVLILRIAATRLQPLRKRLALLTACDIFKSFAIGV